MKKTIVVTIFLLSAGMANAQFEIDQYGAAHLGPTAPQYAQMNIGSNNTCVHAMRTGTPNGIGPAVDAQSYITGSQWCQGARGAAYGGNGAINCGIWGISGNGGVNKNYGVFGCLNASKGAGIYGQAYNWTSTSGTALTTAYAGYFDGAVHVQGNFSYSGTLLTSSPSPLSLSHAATLPRTNQSQTTTQLFGLEVQTYYLAIPNKSSRNAMSEEDFAGMDSMEIEAIKASMSSDEDSRDVIADQVLSKQHYTLKAEQLEEVFPNLVYDNEDGTKSINYVEMVPILVQAINELSAKVAELEGKDGAVRKVEARTTGINDVDGSVEFLALGQNKPNPFGTSTEIEVSVPESVQSAFVYVYDLQGKKVQQVNITARGKQTVQLNAADLTDGMYLYSLIADGKVVETRRMIVEK